MNAVLRRKIDENAPHVLHEHSCSVNAGNAPKVANNVFQRIWHSLGGGSAWAVSVEILYVYAFFGGLNLVNLSWDLVNFESNLSRKLADLELILAKISWF